MQRILSFCIALALSCAFLAPIATPAEKEEKSAEGKIKGHRTIVLKKGDEIPRDFHQRQGPAGIIRQIEQFMEKLPEDHTAKIVIGKFLNQNYGGYDDRIDRMVMLGPDGKKDGLEKTYAGGGEGGGGLKREIQWKDGIRHGTEKVYSRGPGHGLYVQETIPWVKGKVHGTVQVFYPDGEVMAKVPYVHGKQEGVSKSFSEEGKLTQVVLYKKGKREGKMIQYWPKTGKKKKVVPCENGMVDGTARLFYDDGTLKAEMPFREDTLHGVEKRYDEDGELQRKRYWLDGELVPEGVFKDKYKKD
ncbi:MAG: toxin-antitoxin system YwqK family antitoxin [Candidatus Brocadiia bacterium]